MIRILCVLVIFLLHGCGSSHKSPVIGVDPSWSPQDFGKQGAYVNGFVDDLLKEIATQEGVKFEKMSANAGDLLEGLRRGEYDAILTSLPPYSFNRAKYDFSESFLELGPVLIVLEKSSTRKLSQMGGEMIGTVSGDDAEVILDQYPNILIKPYRSIPDLLNAVVNQEVGGALLGKILAGSYVLDLYRGSLKIVSSPLSDQGLRLIAEKGKQEEMVRSFDRSLKALKRKKKLPALLKKWSLS